MKRIASVWVLLRSRSWSKWLVCFSLLVLPWQTRYFIEAPFRGGQPWEQGRWSMYGSMMILLAACIVWCMEHRAMMLQKKWRGRYVGLVLIGLSVLAIPTLSGVATGQWFLQAFTLGSFALIIVFDERLRSAASIWLLVSLLIVALFSCAQTGLQFVPVLKWLGVAAQDPAIRGVSVIESGSQRFLRAYGSFPHPNILGGWMGIGILIALDTYRRRANIYWLTVIALLTFALYGSFSRSAWIALAFGLIWMTGMYYRDSQQRRRMFFASLVGLTVFGLGGIARPDLVFTRLQTHTRLEQRSIDQRQASVVQALGVVHLYPWFGTGVNAYRVGLDAYCQTTPCSAPAEPPHLVPLLILAELGWVRFILLLGVGLFVLNTYRNLFFSFVHSPFLISLSVLLLFDHYLWSLWAGQTLLAVAIIVCVATRSVGEGSRESVFPI